MIAWHCITRQHACYQALHNPIWSLSAVHPESAPLRAINPCPSDVVVNPGSIFPQSCIIMSLDKLRPLVDLCPGSASIQAQVYRADDQTGCKDLFCPLSLGISCGSWSLGRCWPALSLGKMYIQRIICNWVRKGSSK